MDTVQRDAIIKALAHSRMVGREILWIGQAANAILAASTRGALSLPAITNILMPLCSDYAPQRFVGEAAERVDAVMRFPQGADAQVLP